MSRQAICQDQYQAELICGQNIVDNWSQLPEGVRAEDKLPLFQGKLKGLAAQICSRQNEKRNKKRKVKDIRIQGQTSLKNYDKQKDTGTEKKENNCQPFNLRDQKKSKYYHVINMQLIN